MQPPFADRRHAGSLLARQLEHLRGRPALLVLGLPRGGVPVAFEVARHLNAVLDILLVRKLGVPWHAELAMGAIASGGRQVLNHRLIDTLGIRDADVQEAVRRETGRIREQEALYRPARSPVVLRHQCVILVDDGIATGSTMQVAVATMHDEHPAHLVVAAPVGAPKARARLQATGLIDEVVFTHEPESFQAVGEWYEDFSPTSDQEVRNLLMQAESAVGGAKRGGP
jgi:putative phosphoribosyl transferase